MYNANGIGAWCFEAASALSGKNIDVRLVVQPGIKPPKHLETICLYFPLTNGQAFFQQKILRKFKRVFQFLLPVAFNQYPVCRALNYLEESGFEPDFILACQPDFMVPGINIPQWVVARTYPASFWGYFGQLRQASSIGFVSRLNLLWYWYRMDRLGYRNATGILALSQALFNQLKGKGYRVEKVYPGVQGPDAWTFIETTTRVNVITAALGLQDKRKNIHWLVKSLSKAITSKTPVSITLAGGFSPPFDQWVYSLLPCQVSLPGHLAREKLLVCFRQSDLFIFSSLQENWGYVLVEAMANGCAVLAPAQYPFTEIIGRPDYLYKPGNQKDFIMKWEQTISNPAKLKADRRWFFDRYRFLFSEKAFGEQLIAAIDPNFLANH